MTKRQGICYGIAAGAVILAVALIEQKPLLAIGALAISFLAERVAR